MVECRQSLRHQGIHVRNALQHIEDHAGFRGSKPVFPAIGEAVGEYQSQHRPFVGIAITFPEIAGVCEEGEREFEHFPERALRAAGLG